LIPLGSNIPWGLIPWGLSTNRIESGIVTNQGSLGGNYDGSATKTEGFAEAAAVGRRRAKPLAKTAAR
jgi:hypothetical protein